MALIICPDCQKEISSEAKNCPNCGLPIKRIHRQSASLVENSTSFTTETIGAGERAGKGFMAILCGVAVLLIPIIGWILGPILIIIGICFFFMKSSTLATRTGSCPYCTLPVQTNGDDDAFSCKHCAERIIVKGRSFHTMASLANQDKKTKIKCELEALPPKESNTSTLRIARNGEDLGEHSISTIEKWISTGFISKDDYYFDTAFNQWRVISLVIEAENNNME
ncbi:MAG: hypothetical protein WCS31_11430 [Verrucomicrobiae bacterium]